MNCKSSQKSELKRNIGRLLVILNERPAMFLRKVININEYTRIKKSPAVLNLQGIGYD